MKLFWPIQSLKKETRPPHPDTDLALTRSAAALLRGCGLPELAARVGVRWHARLTSTAGLARPGESLVLLNPRLREFPGETERTLRHELAHLAAHARAGRRRIASHGPEWRRACADLGIAGESCCHTLPLPTRRMERPIAYQCPACRFVLRRARALKPRARAACRDCCRQHAKGRFDPRFEFVRLAE